MPKYRVTLKENYGSKIVVFPCVEAEYVEEATEICRYEMRSQWTAIDCRSIDEDGDYITQMDGTRIRVA